jgi:hypothetical protein
MHDFFMCHGRCAFGMNKFDLKEQKKLISHGVGKIW